MVEVIRRANSLQRRIAAGQADPISDREREQLEELRRTFIRRFGEEPDDRPAARDR
ncbi:hypothetical protein [Rathayibacter sp. VKM Ac-2857]|uniref:hypothetical protein n=1 Tax=Rathayibacter sp. VKM Ac-2857 TaxID=2739020 RepID=UPI0015653FC0|nr:hypothetical protein [Rathayibacter sp. VKM Ac-2857]NQX18072.1 hypothetical protein [Rathayibacter sp. VKM Ac-2857]